MPIEFRGKDYYIEIRYKEKGHNQPHVHVVEKGTGRSVSIAIGSGFKCVILDEFAYPRKLPM